MTLYTPFKQRIQSILDEKRGKNSTLSKAFSFTGNKISGIDPTGRNLIKEQRDFSKSTPLELQSLGTLINPGALDRAKLGQHPDFVHLIGTDEVEYHYIVSVFIDIQGSTNLHKKHDLIDIYRITNTIQSAAIKTCVCLGGHVQRLQGDGVFAYFGGKGIDRKRAVEMAITACSMFTYFVDNDIKDLFLIDGIEGISTRIGIDFGDDDDVLWANFGLLDVSELTTNSLHTSLASKMQQWAKRNGIVIGQNVKDHLKLPEDLFDYVRNSKGEIEKRYIFENSDEKFYYTQYEFKWIKFLKTLPFIHSTPAGELYLATPEEQQRAANLRRTVAAVTAGNAYLNQVGRIDTNSQQGVHHQPHRFHYGK
jgi:adenylate cyclase